MAGISTLDALRARVRALECTGTPARAVLPLGLPRIDAALPWGGLPLGRLHQVTGGADGFLAPALAFTAHIAGKLAESRGPALWVVEADSADDALYGPGLAVCGLTPDRLVVARARDQDEVLWCMEESLRCLAISAVIGQVRTVTMTASRRLQLAAEQGGATGFLLPSAYTTPAATAATTRWRITPFPSAPVPWEGLGAIRWTVTLERCQGAVPGAWLVERNDATGDLAVVSALSGGSADPAGEPRRRLA